MFNRTTIKFLILLVSISVIVVDSQYFSVNSFRTYPRIGKRGSSSLVKSENLESKNDLYKKNVYQLELLLNSKYIDENQLAEVLDDMNDFFVFEISKLTKMVIKKF
jgi:hypothetical protein